MNGLTAVEMRKDRKAAIDEAGKLLKAAAAAKRQLTPDEEKRFDDLHNDADRLLASAERLELQERKEMELVGKRMAAVDGQTETAADDGDGVVLRKQDSFAAWARAKGHADGDYHGLTVGGVVRALCAGPKTDVERRALAEGADATGGVTVPVLTSTSFIDKLRTRTVSLRAGATVVPLETDKTAIARLSGDPTCAWRLENASIGPSDPTFQRLQFDVQTLAALVVVSRELFEDSVNIETILNNAFIQAFAVELDRACLFGSGTPPEPQGIFGASGIGSVSMGTNGATLAASAGYAKLVDLMQTLADANAATPTAFIMAPRTQAQLAKLVDTTNQPLVAPAMVAAIPQHVTTAVPITQTQGSSGAVASCVIAGNFPELYIGMRTSLRIWTLRERYADLGQIGLLGWLRADVQIAHAASFAKLIGIL